MGIEDNYLIRRLMEGKSTKIMLMAHNAYWCQLEKFKSVFDNFEITVFGSGTAYARMRKNDIPEDCDFIILDGQDFYKDYEFDEIKKMAVKMSNHNKKRVSVGYIYIIPFEKRLYPDLFCEVRIASFKNGEVYEEMLAISDHDLLTLAGIIVKIHNELENQIVLQRDENNF